MAASAPYLARDLDDESQFGELLVLGHAHFPGTIALSKPHWVLIASCSSGAKRDAASIRRLISSLRSSSRIFDETRPSTAIFPFGKKRSGSKPPARGPSYSRKYVSALIALRASRRWAHSRPAPNPYRCFRGTCASRYASAAGERQSRR